MPIYKDRERGTFVFEFSRYVNGRRVRATKNLPKGWTQTQADAFDRHESARLYAVAQGVGASDASIEDAVAVYLTHRAPDLKNYAGLFQELHALYDDYKGRPMTALPDVCKAIAIKAGKAGLAPATIKNKISYLRAACRYAWKHHNLGDNDPGTRVSVPTVRNERHNYVTRADMLKLARACTDKTARAFIRIAFYSGMRLGEIERARVVGGNFVLDDTKNGDRRVVPIHPRIRCCLKYTAGTRYKTGYHWRKAREAVGMVDLRFHDLRHAAASELINQGVDLYTVGAVLGHRSAASSKRYAHLATERLAEAIGKMGKRA
ncbi:MAG: site-specific integrase [Polaromonas sp.]|nr:site-specific integrase [Polaromonas sp.]